MAIPQRADMVLERCTNAVASPFGVMGALDSALRGSCGNAVGSSRAPWARRVHAVRRRVNPVFGLGVCYAF